jgi:hypothetical protein
MGDGAAGETKLSFLRKRPLFEKSGAKAFMNLSPDVETPEPQIQKVFLVLFLQKKNCFLTSPA